MKKISFILLLIMNLCILIHPSYGDLNNPPKIESVRVDSSQSYKAGDDIAIDIAYSGGNPGLSKSRLGLYISDSIDNSGSSCISFEDWTSSVVGVYSKSDYGIYKPGILRIYGSITSNCFQGVNNFFGFLYIYDKTDLQAYNANWEFSINVVDGKRIAAGIQLPDKKDSSFNLNFLSSTFVFDGVPKILELPKKTSEGVLLLWSSNDEICRIKRDFPGQFSNRLEFLKIGKCNLTAVFSLVRSEYKNFNVSKEILVISSADKATAELKAKQEAEAKAIADKAAAELKAKQEAEAKAAAELKAKQEADANRREQIISSTPFRTGPVPFSSTGLPTKVASSSDLPVFAYNSTNEVCVYENGVIRTKTSGRCVIAFSQEGNSEFKPASNLVLDFVIVSTTKKTTITCTKGKLVKKVTSVKPKCPSGYKVKK